MGRCLEVHVFGEVEVRRPDGTRVETWERPTGRRLLCLLLLSRGRTVTRIRAAELLFPAAGTRGPNALAKAIHWCRQALGEPWNQSLVADGGMLRWEGEARTDADAVLHAARTGVLPLDLAALRAMTKQAGPLLPGWHEGWVDDLREEVRLGQVMARSALARALRAGGPGGLDEACALWQSLVDDDPLDEGNQLGLLQTLFAAGREDAARAAWRSCRQVLWAELESVPSPELEEVWRSRGTSGSTGATHPDPPVTTVSVREPDNQLLVGRSQELARLIGLLEGADHLSGGSATLLRPAGAGKSRLLRAATSHFRARGWQVAEASASTRSSHPYGTARTLLRQLLADDDRTSLDRLLGAGLSPPTAYTPGAGGRHLARRGR